MVHSQDDDLFEKIKAELQCYSTEEDCAQLIKEKDSHFDELVNRKNKNDLKIKYERIQIFMKSINDFAVLIFQKSRKRTDEDVQTDEPKNKIMKTK